MNFKSPTFSTICANLIFCIAVIVFFGRNTMLRLPAVGALFKEYLSGCIVLGLFYFQRIVIYPKIRFGITLRFILIGLPFALLSAFLEILLVYPQVMNLLMANCSREESFRVLFHHSLYVFLRNVAILVVSYFVSEFKNQKQLCNTYEIRIRENSKEIPVVPVEEKIRKELIAFPSSSKEQTTFVTEETSEESGQSPCDTNSTTADYLFGRTALFAYREDMVLYSNEKHPVCLFLRQSIVFSIPLFEKIQKSYWRTFFLPSLQRHSCNA